MRPGTAWQARELSVAGHLARAGAPVVAPSAELPPGPHEHDGRVLSFWDYARPVASRRPGARRRGPDAVPRGAARPTAARCRCSAAITEAEALLARLAAEERIDADSRDVAAAALPGPDRRCSARCAPRSSRSTATRTSATCSGGPLWNDWEDTCLGPVGWDAACLLAGRDGRERQEAAYAASGMRLDPGELELWIEARSLQVAVWRLRGYVVAGHRSPSALHRHSTATTSK